MLKLDKTEQLKGGEWHDTLVPQAFKDEVCIY